MQKSGTINNNLAVEILLLQPIKILYKNDITQIKEVPKLFDAVYSSINNFIKQQGLITGKMMAFYLGYQILFF